MFIEERHGEIMKVLQKQKRITINEIVDKFHVSLDTARRDLRLMEEKGQLKRTYGGAIINQKARKFPNQWDLSYQHIKENVMQIAEKVVSFIQPNESIYLDGTFINCVVSKILPEDLEITVVTNSVYVAANTLCKPKIDTFVAGGMFRKNQGIAVDGFAQDFISNFRFDKSFLSGAGFSAAEGLYNVTTDVARLQRTVISHSAVNICEMANDKLNRTSFILVSPSANFQYLITDEMPAPQDLAEFKEKDIEVI